MPTPPLPTEQQIAAVSTKLREALEHGDRAVRKRLLQSVVAEIRVVSRHKIQTYFRVPGTNNAPEGAVRAPCTRVDAARVDLESHNKNRDAKFAGPVIDLVESIREYREGQWLTRWGSRTIICGDADESCLARWPQS